MLIADIKGKLSLKEWTSEDFLTSSVFSTFKYLDSKYLNDFLRKAKNINGDFFDINIDKVEFEFWPWYNNDMKNVGGAEPDLVLYCDEIAIIIEAKNFSGKSGSGYIELHESKDQTRDKSQPLIIDQLVREYFIGAKNLLRKKVKDFYLIYLTRDNILPHEDLSETLQTISQFYEHEFKKATNKIYWVNWSKSYSIFEKITLEKNQNSFEVKICSDLLAFMERRNLDTFDGFDFSHTVDDSESYISMSKSFTTGFIFFNKLDEDYWKFISCCKMVEKNEKNLFYREEKTLYWQFLNKIQDLPTLNTLYYA